jgi:hypothetical protein
MGISYDAGLFYGVIKKREEFPEPELEEYGFCECLEGFLQKYEGLSYVILGYDEDKQAVIGKSISFVGYYKDYEEVALPTKEELRKVEDQLDQKCKFISFLSIS